MTKTNLKKKQNTLQYNADSVFRLAAQPVTGIYGLLGTLRGGLSENEAEMRRKRRKPHCARTTRQTAGYVYQNLH